ncbi:MAG: hypothetical protein DBY39_00685 [Clostridiales bacterium]|nr:MAG: hypothetical protein DBY39_00685 [Clostridiales bacterium]
MFSWFFTPCSNGFLSKSAQKLYITQPTLSNRIHSLEKDLNATLFLRKKGMREMQLTDIGHQFVPIAEKWQDLWKERNALPGRKQKV